MNTFPAGVYVARRNRLKNILGKGQILLIGNTESSINFKDNWYPFRQDSSLLYFTGIDQPDIHLLIDIDENRETIYGDELTIDDVVWTGPLPSIKEISSICGINKVKPLIKLKEDVRAELMYLPAYRAEHLLFLSDVLGKNVNEVETSYSTSLILSIISMRNIKEPSEIIEMNKAVAFSYDMHKAVMQASRPHLYEHDLVGVASRKAYSNNVHFSYPAILTTRGEVLHNHNHNGQLSPDDIVLYDGGCESPLHYAGDITRTFPVNGKWTGLQKEMYDVVYQAYKESVDLLRPGIRFIDVHLQACKTLSAGLKDLGFIKGDIEDVLANGAHTLFFQCGLGHLIGLDVHDMENLGEIHVGYGEELEKSTQFGLKSLRLGRSLQEGFALTVEPGIYIIPILIELRKSEGLYKDFINYDKLEKYKDFGGIRLEDNFIITSDGYEMLGADIDMPRTSVEVEEFMKM